MLKSLMLEEIQWMDALAVLNNTLQKDSTLHMTADIGTSVHLAIENYLNNDEWDKFGSSFEEKMSEKITNRFFCMI